MRRLLTISFFCFLFAVVSVSAFADDANDIMGKVGFIHPSAGAGRRAPMSPSAAAFDSSTYHNGSTLYCSGCHVMHASEQHGLTPIGSDPFGPYPQTFTPTAKLLKASSSLALCVTCHDNHVGIPDVVGADVNGLVDRAGGFFAAPGVDNPDGHKLEYDPDGAGGPHSFQLCGRCHFTGTFATASVTCVDCHNPHGNGKARNLQWASAPGDEPEFGMYIAPGAAGLARYEAGNVGYPAPNVDEYREVTNMCIDCHHVFTGKSYNDPSNTGWHVLHPSYDSERGDPNTISQGDVRGTTISSHWVNGTGAGFRVSPRVRYLVRGAASYSASKVVAGANGVFCLSCHKAHGSASPFGLTWDPLQEVGGEGCDQCHAKTGN